MAEAVRDADTIASLVARNYENNGRSVCVKNYGQVGWVSTQELIKLVLQLKQADRKPNAVVFYDGTMDAAVAYESDQFDVHTGFPVLKKQVESWNLGVQRSFEYLHNTNTFTELESVARRYRLGNDAVIPPTIAAGKAALLASRTAINYTKNMEILDALSAYYGFRHVCFLEPWLMSGEKQLSPAEVVLRDDEEQNNPGMIEVMRAAYQLLSAVHRPDLIDLGQMFDAHPETVFADLTHLREEGNRLVAERIAGELQQRSR